MNTRLRSAGAWVAVLLVVVLAACGRKTEPITPDSPRPGAVTGVQAVVRDAVAYLSWPVPMKNSEGKDMDPAAIKGFRVYRAELGADRRRPRYKQVAEFGTENPAPAEIRNNLVFWSDPGLQFGRVYGYRIRAFSASGGAGAYSDEVRAAPVLSLAAPKNPIAAAGDSVVTLNWDAVSSRSDGSMHQGFIGYNLYRGTGTGPADDAPLNSEPVRINSYADTSAKNGTAYTYRIRAVDSPQRPWRESLDSSAVSAAPRDMTPPEPPQGITVVPGVGRVFLTWNENRERDLAGYHVYRSPKSGGGYVRLTEQIVKRTTYSDETVKPGMTYYYVLTAVDNSGNESAYSRENRTYTETAR